MTSLMELENPYRTPDDSELEPILKRSASLAELGQRALLVAALQAAVTCVYVFYIFDTSILPVWGKIAFLFGPGVLATTLLVCSMSRRFWRRNLVLMCFAGSLLSGSVPMLTCVAIRNFPGQTPYVSGNEVAGYTLAIGFITAILVLPVAWWKGEPSPVTHAHDDRPTMRQPQ